MDKTSKFSIIIVIVIILGFIIISGSTFIVYEDEVAVVKNFGRITKVIVNPGDAEKVRKNHIENGSEDIIIRSQKGLNFKIPFFQTVVKYDSKNLTYTSNKETINTNDRRTLDIQMYAQYRILDPERFNLAVGSKSKANSIMDDRVYPVVIQSVNKLDFNEFFGKGMLEDLVNDKLVLLNEQLLPDFGIYVTDIGINRKTFPLTNIPSVEAKMTKQIEKESEKLIADGNAYYQKRKATVDRERQELIAGAVIIAAETKALADAEALRVYQESLVKDLDFFKFIQRMEIYKNLRDTTVFLDKDNDLLKYINNH